MTTHLETRPGEKFCGNLPWYFVEIAMELPMSSLPNLRVGNIAYDDYLAFKTQS